MQNAGVLTAWSTTATSTSWWNVAAPQAPEARTPHRSDPPTPFVCCSARATSRRVRYWWFLTRRAAVLSFRPHHGAVAQLVAHLVRNEGVRGSSPLSSTDRIYNRRPKALSEPGLFGGCI